MFARMFFILSHPFHYIATACTCLYASQKTALPDTSKDVRTMILAPLDLMSSKYWKEKRENVHINKRARVIENSLQSVVLMSRHPYVWTENKNKKHHGALLN